jgi:hypothetical protein
MFIKNEDYIIREENEFYLAYNYIAHTYYQLNEIAIIVISEAAKMVLTILSRNSMNHYKDKLPPILSGSLLFIESTIPDTLFFQPAFPFSDYCLKRGKAQLVEYQPEES